MARNSRSRQQQKALRDLCTLLVHDQAELYELEYRLQLSCGSSCILFELAIGEIPAVKEH